MDDVAAGRNRPVLHSALAIEVDRLMVNGHEIFLLLRDIFVVEVGIHLFLSKLE